MCILRSLWVRLGVTKRLGCYFNISPFTTINICQIAKNISQIRFKIWPITEQTLKILPKILKILPNW